MYSVGTKRCMTSIQYANERRIRHETNKDMKEPERPGEASHSLITHTGVLQARLLASESGMLSQ